MREQGRKAECRFRFGTAIGDDPMMSPKSAVSAAKAILAKTGHSYQEIDAFEVNEAFAVIDVLLKTVIISGAGHLPMGIHMESPAQ